MLAVLGLLTVFSGTFLVSSAVMWFLRTIMKLRIYRGKVIILRGLPGSGKTQYIQDYIDTQRISNYAICSANHYFYRSDDKGEKYKFNPRELPQAHNSCLAEFLDALFSRKRVIFVNNPNSLTWEYENYVTLARQYHYKCEIVEIDCPNPAYVEYFNNRCRYKVNLATCASLYDRWETDHDATRLEPYDKDFNDEDVSFPGDSLPYPKKTLAELDDELDFIASQMRKGCTKRRSVRLQKKNKDV